MGPGAVRTLEVLAGLGERAIWVHGNCEREMVAAFDGVTVPGPRPSRRSPRSPASRKARRGNCLICTQSSGSTTRAGMLLRAYPVSYKM